jgi:hypothetical protein
VVVSFAEECARYGVKEVIGDAYGGEWPREQFRKAGLTYRLSEQHKSEIYLSALPLMTSGRVELLDHKRLVAQMGALERRTGRTGRDTVDHPPRGRDDVANAAAGALVLAAGHAKSFHLTWATTITTAEKVRAYYADGAQRHNIDGQGTSYLGEGRYIARNGEVFRDPRGL